MQTVSDWMLSLDWDQKVTGNHASPCKKSHINSLTTLRFKKKKQKQKTNFFLFHFELLEDLATLTILKILYELGEVTILFSFNSS